jgi:hypothetical protein
MAATAPSFLSRLHDSLKNENTKSFVMPDVRILTHVAKFMPGGTQLRAYVWVVAMTASRGCIGDRAQDWTDPISTQEWCELLQCKERQVTDILTDAVDRGMLRRKEVRNKGFRYQLGLDLDKIADYVRPEPAEASDDEDEEVADDATVEAGSIILPPMMIGANSRTRPVDLRTAVSSVRYISDSDTPIQVGMRAAKGVLFVNVALLSSSKKSSRGVQSSAPPQIENILQGGAVECTPLRQDLRVKIQEVFSSRALGPITDNLWAKICQELGETPDDWMTETVTQKLSTRRYSNLQPGLFVNFASDAASRCADWVSSSRKKQAIAAPEVPDQSAAAFAAWLKGRGFTDGSIPAVQYLELLEEYEQQKPVAV